MILFQSDPHILQTAITADFQGNPVSWLLSEKDAAELCSGTDVLASDLKDDIIIRDK